MSLDRWFKDCGIDLREVGPGATTPTCFSDVRLEHLATRRTAGLFDFSFMTCFEITGRDSLHYLERLQVRKLVGLEPGRIAYTLMCREDGTVINDATVWCLGPGHYWLFTGRRSDLTHLERVAAAFDIGLSDCSGRYAIIALQGPKSLNVLQRCFPGQDLESLTYYRFRQHKFSGTPCWIARIGYSGELGYELVTDCPAGLALWQRLVAAGEPSALLECGFDAANSLRIEAGHILFTRELALPVTPDELGLGRLVSQFGAVFLGSEVLRAGRWRDAKRRFVGLIPQAPDEIPYDDFRGDRVAGLLPLQPSTGFLTSTCVSPIFGRLGLGFVCSEDRYPGTRVDLGGGCRAQVARLPFYDPSKKLPRTLLPAGCAS